MGLSEALAGTRAWEKSGPSWRWPLLRWFTRHRKVSFTLGLAAVLTLRLGPQGAFVVLVVVAFALLTTLMVWWAHEPEQFRDTAVPHLAGAARRWTGPYVGPRWNDTVRTCGLVVPLGDGMRPRLPWVRHVVAVSGCRDMVLVGMAKGQTLTAWQQPGPVLASCLHAERVVAVAHGPRTVRLHVLRRNPFPAGLDRAVEQPRPPRDATARLRHLLVGRTEDHAPWTVDLARTHLLVVGADEADLRSVRRATLARLHAVARDHPATAPGGPGGPGGPAAPGGVRLHLVDLRPVLDTFDDPMFGTVVRDDEAVRAFLAEQVQVLRRKKADPQGEGAVHDVLVLHGAERFTLVDTAGFEPGHLVLPLTTLLRQGAAHRYTVAWFHDAPTPLGPPLYKLFGTSVCLAGVPKASVDQVLRPGATARGALLDLLAGGQGQGFATAPRHGYPRWVRGDETLREG